MGRPRSATAHRSALDATVQVLLESGLDGVTLEEVAARSGVAKTTLYRHFGSKEALVAQAARCAIVEYPTPDTGSLLDDLRSLFDRFKQVEEANQLEPMLAMLIDAAPRHPDLQALLDEVLAERRRPLRTILQLAQHRGEIDPELDLEVAMAILIGPFTYRRMVEGREITPDFVDTVATATVAGLRATARHASPT